MRGLLKNNMYTAISSIKIFLVVIVLGGFLITVVINPDLINMLIIYELICLIGFSVISDLSLRKENASKWSKYKLTTPVKRCEIIKSYYISQLIWLMVGIVIASAVIGISTVLHGFLFDKYIDVLTLIVAGISISLLMDALFFPILNFGGEEKSEVFLVISLFLSVGIVVSICSFINWLFGESMTTMQLFIGITTLLLCAVIGFLVSIPITIKIFEKKQ